MKKISAKSVIFLFAVIISVAMLNRFLFKGRLSDFALRPVKASASYVFSRASALRQTGRQIGTIRSLTLENIRLTEENQKLTAGLAGLKELEDENRFLRKSMELAEKHPRRLVYGNIFSLSLAPAGYEMLLNKGRSDGVSVDDIVVSDQGVLIGQVKEVLARSSRVRLVTDPAFAVTAKVLAADTSGIAKGDLDKGILLDLIVHADPIKQGDTIVTSGNDLIPPGLLIGTVRSVDENQSKVFKSVRIKPALDETILGRVLIIKTD